MKTQRHQALSQEITDIAKKLLDKGIRSDRDVFKKLSLYGEEKELMLQWIHYQSLLSERKGLSDGREDMKQDIKNLLGIEEHIGEHLF